MSDVLGPDLIIYQDNDWTKEEGSIFNPNHTNIVSILLLRQTKN